MFSGSDRVSNPATTNKSRRLLERGELGNAELQLFHFLGLGAGDAPVVVGIGGLDLELGLLGLGPLDVTVVVEIRAGGSTFWHVESAEWVATFRNAVRAFNTVPKGRKKHVT